MHPQEAAVCEPYVTLGHTGQRIPGRATAAAAVAQQDASAAAVRAARARAKTHVRRAT